MRLVLVHEYPLRIKMGDTYDHGREDAVQCREGDGGACERGCGERDRRDGIDGGRLEDGLEDSPFGAPT